jgi:hypothetical protein
MRLSSGCISPPYCLIVNFDGFRSAQPILQASSVSGVREPSQQVVEGLLRRVSYTIEQFVSRYARSSLIASFQASIVKATSSAVWASEM